MLITPPPLVMPSGHRLYFLGRFKHVTAQGSVNSGTLVLPEAGLVVGICCGYDNSSSRAVSGMTFGGTAGTLHKASASNLGFSGIASLAMAAGSMTGVIANHGTADGGALHVWLLAGLTSNTPVNVQAVGGNTTTTLSPSINTSARGVAVGGHLHSNANAATWVGLTKQAEDTVTSADSYAWLDPTVTATPLTVTTSWSGSTRGGSAAGAWL